MERECGQYLSEKGVEYTKHVLEDENFQKETLEKGHLLEGAVDQAKELIKTRPELAEQIMMELWAIGKAQIDALASADPQALKDLEIEALLMEKFGLSEADAPAVKAVIAATLLHDKNGYRLTVNPENKDTLTPVEDCCEEGTPPECKGLIISYLRRISKRH